jgi:hypothetical protein
MKSLPSRLRAAVGAAALLVACGDRPSQTRDSGAPEGHTLSNHGVLHRPGIDDPLANCTGCHGDSLQGDKGPSCTECHGRKW